MSLKSGRFRYATDDPKVILGILMRHLRTTGADVYRVGYYKGHQWRRQITSQTFATEEEAQHWLDDYADEHGHKIIVDPSMFRPKGLKACPMCGRRFNDNTYSKHVEGYCGQDKEGEEEQ